MRLRNRQNIGGSVGFDVDSYELSYRRNGDHMCRYYFTCDFSLGLDVLDYGCGGGYGCKLLATAGGARRVCGVDVDRKAIESAKSHYASLSDVTFQAFDGYSTPFPDGAFDMVVSFEVIEHVQFANRYLDEVARVLNRRGLAVMSTPNRNLTRLGYWMGMNPWKYHLREYSPREFRRLLETKFRTIKLYKLHRTDYADVNFYAWLAGSSLAKFGRFAYRTLIKSPRAEQSEGTRTMMGSTWSRIALTFPASRNLPGPNNMWVIETLREEELEAHSYSHVIAMASK